MERFKPGNVVIINKDYAKEHNTKAEVITDDNRLEWGELHRDRIVYVMLLEKVEGRKQFERIGYYAHRLSLVKTKKSHFPEWW